MTKPTPKTIPIVEQIRQCQLCQDLPLGPKPILQANPQAKILIAGQAPGRITHHKGIPFDDPSGNRLREWLGVSREQFYDDKLFSIVPMSFCFPGSYTKEQGKGGDLPPPAICAETWRKQLLAQLSNLELSLIIGRYALDWHLNIEKKQTLTQVVANWRDYFPEQLPLPHPSPRNNRWLKNNPWFEQEILPTLQQRVSDLIT